MPSAANPLDELTLAELRRRTSMKWRTHPSDVLPLWVAEMDVRLAPPVAAALQDAVEAGDTGYPVAADYIAAVQQFAAERWDWQAPPAERCALVPDVMLGIVEALRLLTEPGDPVIVTPPVYPPFYAFVTSAGRRIVEAPLTAAGRLDPERLDTAMKAARRLSPRCVLLLSNPHNPTGVAHTRAELSEIAAVAGRHGVRVIVDEIHAPLVLPGTRHVPYLSVPGSEDGFSLMSASKAWNLAGMKAALLLAGPAAAADLNRLPEEVGHGASHFGVLSHAAAFAHGQAWLDALLAGLDRNRQFLAQVLPSLLPQLDWLRPEATYLAWLDCRALGLHRDGDQGAHVVSELAGPARFFLDRARVALSSGHLFGTGGNGFVRLNYATSATILDEALHRLAGSLDVLSGAAP